MANVSSIKKEPNTLFKNSHAYENKSLRNEIRKCLAQAIEGYANSIQIQVFRSADKWRGCALDNMRRLNELDKTRAVADSAKTAPTITI